MRLDSGKFRGDTAAVESPSDVNVWASHSAVTAPGALSEWLLEVPGDISVIRRVSQELVQHYTGASDGSFVPVRGPRLQEVDLRFAAAMLERLKQLGAPVLDRSRPLAERIVRCCRDFAVLFVAIAREKGIPARVRVGYASYFIPDWYLDHVVAEVWDGGAGRWRLVEAEITDAFARKGVNGGPLDPLDVPRDRFLTGPQAWREAREGRLDPGRCVVAPDFDEPYTRGWSSLRVHVVHDLQALAKAEMLLWDQWGIMNEDDPLSHAALLDDVAGDTSDPGCRTVAIADWAMYPGLEVPNTVTSYSPAHRGPRSINVSAALAGRLRS